MTLESRLKCCGCAVWWGVGGHVWEQLLADVRHGAGGRQFGGNGAAVSGKVSTQKHT